MIILGIDPALGNCGWGIILQDRQNLKYIDSGVIKTTTAYPIYVRLTTIYSKLENIILKYRPEKIAMEETFINKNPTSSLKLGYVRGAIMALVGKYEKDFIEFTPNAIKKTVVGSGHAEKEQILHMIKILIQGANIVENLDIADALAIAYTCSVYNAQ